MENTLRELLQERDGYLQEARGIKDLAKKEERLRTDKEQAKVDGLLVKIRSLNKTVEQDKEMQEYQERFSKPLGEPVKPDPNDNPWGVGIGQFAGGAPNQTAMKAARGHQYRHMFGLSERTLDTGGFDNVEDFFKAIHSGRADTRLDSLQLRAMTEGVPADGGFAVPEEFSAWLLDASLESEIIRPRAQVWPMAHEERKVPGWDASDHSSNLYGGLRAYWEGEASTLTETEPKTRQIKLSAKKLTILASSSNELLADGLDFENQLGMAISKAMGWYLDYKFLNGDGAGQPLGIINDPALITITKEAGQAANTIVYDNIIKMFARLAPQSHSRAVWIGNNTCVPQLLKLVVPVGTGGSVIQVLRETSGRFFMLGKEVLFTEKVPALGSANQLLLVDPSQYAIGLRKDMNLDKSEHVGFKDDVTYFRAILRGDGQGTWSSAITPKNGDSLSWCVALGSTA